MGKIVCFGEIMLRLNPQGYYRIIQSDRFMASYAGAEANVAISLSAFGLETCFVSKLPENELGQAALNSLRRYGVNTKYINRGGNRLGLYFIEKGASQRGSKVIYDRKHSAISEALSDEFDWKDIFSGGRWFHFTGITPALSDMCAASCIAACKAAKEAGLTISCDINFRKNLWSREKARKVMSELMPFVDVCIANEEDASDVFGISAENTDVVGGILSPKGYEKVATSMVEKFGFKQVAFTLRSSTSANDNDWAGLLYMDGSTYLSRSYPIHIVDRVGGGDSFAAGLIYSIINGKDPQSSVDFAVAASCLKHSIENDFNLVTVGEIESLLNGNATGRVQR